MKYIIKSYMPHKINKNNQNIKPMFLIQRHHYTHAFNSEFKAKNVCCCCLKSRIEITFLFLKYSEFPYNMLTKHIRHISGIVIYTTVQTLCTYICMSFPQIYGGVTIFLFSFVFEDNVIEYYSLYLLKKLNGIRFDYYNIKVKCKKEIKNRC